MIHNFLILLDNKLIYSKFKIDIIDNFLWIKNIEPFENNLVKIPIYNKYNGIDYYPVIFPMKMPIINNQIFNPYTILSSFNFSNDNEIDFFYPIKNYTQSNGLEFMSFSQILSSPTFFINLYAQIYDPIVDFNYDIDKPIEEIVTKLWFDINLVKLLVIYLLTKHPNLNKKLIKELKQLNPINSKAYSIANHVRTFNYNLNQQTDEIKMTLPDFLNTNLNKSLKMSEIKPNNYYYIYFSKNDNQTNSTNSQTDLIDKNNEMNKIIKIFVWKIQKNVVSISETKNILFENYKWYYYCPNIKIDKDYIYYLTYISKDFTKEILKKILNIEEVHVNKIIEFYYSENKMSNLISLGNIFSNLSKQLTDMSILKSNSFTDGFFEFITKKYSSDSTDKFFEILEILFENYSYPLKSNRHELDNIFDYIIYISLYNYKFIFIKNNSIHSNIYNNEMLHPNINNIIPNKLKNLYINLIKSLSQIINNEFESITYNQKFYSDYLHRNIIKLFFLNDIEIGNSSLSINLFRNLVKPMAFDKFKNIIQTNLLLIDISNKLSWTNLPKKLNYLSIFYKNNDLVFYQDKLNKNIMNENFDNRIKKIIENPFEMYKYLRKEKDFVKWTKFISDKVIELYYVPISLSSDDFILIGKMIYLLFNINEQNIKEQSYINFLNFCTGNMKLILDSNRINFKIRETFPNLKSNLNLGFLAKHLTWDRESITFDESKPEKTPDVMALEMKLHLATKKYIKYKTKYLETKDLAPGSIEAIDKAQIGKLIKMNDTNTSISQLLDITTNKLTQSYSPTSVQEHNITQTH